MKARVFIILAMIFVMATVLSAQVSYEPERGFLPGMEQLNGGIDSVDIAGGKLHLKIPIASLPAGNGGMGFDLNLQYDSRIYNAFQLSGSNAWQLAEYPGWHYDAGSYALDLEEVTTNNTTKYRLNLVLPDGGSHILLLRGYESADGFSIVNPNGYDAAGTQVISGILRYYTIDGSYLRVAVYSNGSNVNYKTFPWKVYYPDGSHVHVSGNTVTLDDTNSNETTIYTSNNGNTVTIRNSLEKSIVINKNVTNADLNTATWKRDEVIVPIPGVNGSTVTYRIDWKKITLPPGRVYNNGVTPIAPLSPTTMWGVAYIQLPLQQATALGTEPAAWSSYKFDYNTAYGELNYIRTPGGAQYYYEYTFDGTGTVYWDTKHAIDIAGKNRISKKTLAVQGNDNQEWNFTNDTTTTIVTAPDGGETKYTFQCKEEPVNCTNYYLFNRVIQIDSPGGNRIVQEWDQNKVYALQYFNVLPNNLYVKKETITIGSQTNNPKTRVVEYVYNANGRARERSEHDWNTNGAPGAVLRKTLSVDNYSNINSHVIPDASSVAGSITDAATAYWNVNTNRLMTLYLSAVTAGSTKYAVTKYTYDDNGNKTSEMRWDSEKSSSFMPTPENSQTIKFWYDGHGNPTYTSDSEGTTEFTYDDGGRVLSRVVGVGTSRKRETNYTWLNGMAIETETDVDNNTKSRYSYDAVGRRTGETFSYNGTSLRRVSKTYEDEHNRLIIESDLRNFGDKKLKTIIHYDQLGREILTQSSEGGNNDGIKTQTIYQHFFGGTREIVSSPYRALTDATLEWKCAQYDQAGRVTISATFKGSVAPTNCASATNRTGATEITYSADWTTITDPAGKVRKERRDALGRLVEVQEDPSVLNYVTTYTYDVLDNLLTTTQGGQVRTFVYSSLSRLLSATNPESGKTTYTYHESGRVLKQTDARGKWSETTYDSLGQIMQRKYSDDTMIRYDYYSALGTVSFAPQIGRLQSVSSFVGTTIRTTTSYTYNALGNIVTSQHMIAGYPRALNFSYEWYVGGGLKSVTYPSGRKIEYAADDAGRNTKVSTTNKTYWDTTVVNQPFTADGRVMQAKLGNTLWETYDYATPGTPTVYRLGTAAGTEDRMRLEYNFSGTANNGNIMSQKMSVSGGANLTQTFYYDGVNRLSRAIESGGYDRTYGYDRWGNRWVSSSSGLSYVDNKEPTSGAQFNQANNRLTNATYDAAGNQLSYNGYTFEYNAAGQNTVVKTNAGTVYTTNTYDGNGNRVKKVEGSVTTYYIYDALGRFAAEYTSAAPEVGTSYVFTDMLGSVRAITSNAGALQECYDYLPFGRMLSSSDNGRPGCHPVSPDISANSNSRASQKFTGQPRDNGPKLDYFGARFYSASLGRFTTPDSPLFDQHIADPQSWNLYTYARNNPFLYVDPTGKKIELIGDYDERDQAFNFLNNCVGPVAAKLLYIKERQSKNGMRYFVDIKGSVAEFRKLGKAANDLADLIELREIIEFGSTNRNLKFEGGAVTYQPGKDGNNENIRVLINPKQIIYGDINLRNALTGRVKWEGYKETPPWYARELTAEIATWHELGHAWGYAKGMKTPQETNPKALEWENRMREQIYGPLGPKNAPRRIH